MIVFILTLASRTPKKPKSKKMISLATAINASSASAVKIEKVNDAAANGEEESISAKQGDEEEGDERAGQKRKRYITVVENGKKRKMIDQVRPFVLLSNSALLTIVI